MVVVWDKGLDSTGCRRQCASGAGNAFRGLGSIRYQLCGYHSCVMCYFLIYVFILYCCDVFPCLIVSCTEEGFVLPCWSLSSHILLLVTGSLNTQAMSHTKSVQGFRFKNHSYFSQQRQRISTSFTGSAGEWRDLLIAEGIELSHFIWKNRVGEEFPAPREDARFSFKVKYLWKSYK